MAENKRFPIHPDEGKRGGSIPWEAAEKLRKTAERNHSQSLETLAARGGLSWEEMARAALGLHLFKNEIIND